MNKIVKWSLAFMLITAWTVSIYFFSRDAVFIPGVSAVEFANTIYYNGSRISNADLKSLVECYTITVERVPEVVTADVFRFYNFKLGINGLVKDNRIKKLGFIRAEYDGRNRLMLLRKVVRHDTKEFIGIFGYGKTNVTVIVDKEFQKVTVANKTFDVKCDGCGSYNSTASVITSVVKSDNCTVASENIKYYPMLRGYDSREYYAIKLSSVAVAYSPELSVY